MAAEDKSAKGKPEKSAKPKSDKPEKPAKAKAEKPAKDAAAEAPVAEAPPKPAPAPKPPADPRYKVMRKFHGKFLPRGPLRDRLNAIMTRWNSGEDHGGVTVEELKTLLDDWKGTREKPPRKVKV